MKLHRTYRTLMFAAALTVIGLSGWRATLAGVTPSPATPTAAECEGDACAQVTLSFDEAKGQYRAQNNSTSQWVRVTAANLAASATACLGPGKTEYLPLRNVVGTYRAEFSEPKCGSGI